MNPRTPRSNNITLASRAIRARHAFTLTEILIALAMVAFLLIGISRIFATVSTTIGTGQALSTAMRTQRAIQQTMAADILGVLPSAAGLRPYSGMMPLNDKSSPDAGMPFLTISNFRVATYVSQDAMRADSLPPADIKTTNSTTFVNRSATIRGIDLNGDGTKTNTAIVSGGETVPIYAYGERNFRCDTVAFFTRGQFQSQTGVSNLAAQSSASSTYQGGVTSSESYIWYGHMRVFNGYAPNLRLDYSNGCGMPGDWVTPSTGTGIADSEPNTNNRFANQFVLGRVQLLLVEPTDHDARAGSYVPTTPATTYDDNGADRKTEEDNTVIAGNDPSRPAIFVQRNWFDPNANHFKKSRPIPSPFGDTDSLVLYKPDTATSATGSNKTLFADDKTTGDASRDTSAPAMQAMNIRTDIAGVGATQARARIRFLQNYDLGPNGKYEGGPPSPAGSGRPGSDDPSTFPTSSDNEWWESLVNSWQRRYWCNPFITSTKYDRTQPNINAKSIAQRQQILATGCSQFIVEFTGDFVTQDQTPGATFGNVTAPTPDGVPDFVAIPVPGSSLYRRVTRWYGMPRDVDGDGHIYTTLAASRTSTDVLPVSVYANSPRYFFERKSKSLDNVQAIISPFQNSDYGTNASEPTGATDADDTGYVCVWGAQDFERLYSVPNPVDAAHPFQIQGAVPQLLRFVVDVIDPDAKLKQPVTQELIYPVPNDGKTSLN